MTVSNKFLLFNTKLGGFLNEDGKENSDYDLLNGAIFSEDSARQRQIDLEQGHYLQIPVTEEFVNELPVELTDTAPDVPFSGYDRNEALKGDFVVLTPYGFYDEKHNSGEQSGIESSRPKIRSFELDYANLYTVNDLIRTKSDWILSADETDVEPLVIPVSEEQQQNLKQIPEFAEPYGFFMRPLGTLTPEEKEHINEQMGRASELAQKAMEGPLIADEGYEAEQAGLPSLGDALNDLETEVAENEDSMEQ